MCCSVNVYEMDEKKTLRSISEADHCNLLKRLPVITRVPATGISEPARKEEIGRAFESERGCINDRNNVLAIYDLRDYVFRTRVGVCHCNIELFIE